ncbi:abc transporter family protein [Stylonychia lemnae]|uniref:Abc transporter family protein n=1 Tax=Stylonychia lemnae TaxID=5949 RepID=A0A078AJ96_STYLE|nr:abc transporter family protein [Stylonychia lemnae]|eukprot:CDW81562.1 abc transporter family protein [Stylonychia lemnae]
MSISSNSNKGTIDFSTLFRFITKSDKFMLVIGTTAAIITGAVVPVQSILIGELSQTFKFSDQPAELNQMLRQICIYFTIYAFGTWGFAYIYFSFWQLVAENITYDLKLRYLKHLLQQEFEYFENINVEQLPSQMSENFSIIQLSIGQKLAAIIFAITNFLSAITIAFAWGADLAAIYFALFPVIMGIIMMFGAQVKKASINKGRVIQTLSGLVEENLQAIKVILSFAQEEREIEKFNKLAGKVKNVSNQSEFWGAGFMGLLRFSLYCFYSFNYWIGTVYIYYNMNNPNTGNTYTVGEIITINFCVVTCTSMFFQLSPNIQGVVQSKLVCKQLFDLIDRTPKILSNESSEQQLVLEQAISFENVTFKYPKGQKDILKTLSLQIKANTSTALVGESGSGKSTVINLIQRFYDSQEGSIYFDKVHIRDISLDVLRESIGYVQQEPVLIMGTIRENILLGNKDATEQDIERALTLANAMFVYFLEKKLDTHVGTSSLLNLSGGQKQRICIARALLKSPKILILDEATSALDPRSEKDVQQALENIQNQEKNLTTIIIAHRLQTIQSAENLIYFEDNKNVNAASKGTVKYDEIIKAINLKNKELDENFAQDKRQDYQKQKSEIELMDVQRLGDHDFESMDTDKDFEMDSMCEQDNLLGGFEQQVENKTLEKTSQKQYGLREVMKYYGPKRLVALSFISTFFGAFGFPLSGMIFAKIFTIMLQPESSTYIEDRNFWCSLYTVLAFLIGIFEFLNKRNGKVLNENLIYNIRTKLYQSILRKNLGWFDHQERAPGVLSNLFSEEVNYLNGLTSEFYYSILDASMCMIIGCCISFYFNWRIALVCLVTCPVMLFTGFTQQIIVHLSAQNSNKQGSKQINIKDPYNQANALLSDVILNYKTIISFGPKNIDYLIKIYGDLLLHPYKIGVRNAHISGLLNGYATSARYLYISFIFYITGIFIEQYNYNKFDLFIANYTVYLASFAAGFALSQLPSLSKAKQAANKIFGIINENSENEDKHQACNFLIQQGKIEFRDVKFQYPSRNEKVLRKLSFKVPEGKKIAIVGRSGSGKSTIANLLLKMYDFQDGQILIDGVDIKTIDTKNLRTQLGYVMQEPILFNLSIKENIQYGKQEATNQEILEVANQANALQFIEKIQDDNLEITKLPINENIMSDQEEKSLMVQLHPGFDKICGLKGSTLSGGQKQRIAIARALIKNPKILILDEATSALDEQSQEIVQQALDKTMEGKTSIVIAHRLSTIKNCDWILVIHKGKVVEQGTFKELGDNKQTYFYKLKSGMEM